MKCKTMGLIRGAWNFMRGPITFYRQNVKFPIIKFVYETLELYKTRTKTGISNVRELLFRGSVVASGTSLLVWLAIFMYLSFYYMYVPTVSHERPAHLQFRACETEKGMCSFPTAHVQLSKRQQLLMSKQPYRVQLELEMPESPSNKELGMFMVCADFRGKDGLLIANSCRHAMLHYKSWITEVFYTLMFSPLFVLGGAEEKQQIHIELFSHYEDYEHDGVTDVYIEIQSKYIQLYSAKFLINADFSGLRYIMFHWPLLSAGIGVTSNLFFIAIICMISWYQIIHSEEYNSYAQSRNSGITEKFKRRLMDEDSSCSSYEDDTSMVLDNDASLLMENDIHSNLRQRLVEERVEDLKGDIY